MIKTNNDDITGRILIYKMGKVFFWTRACGLWQPCTRWDPSRCNHIYFTISPVILSHLFPHWLLIQSKLVELSHAFSSHPEQTGGACAQPTASAEWRASIKDMCGGLLAPAIADGEKTTPASQHNGERMHMARISGRIPGETCMPAQWSW